MTASPSESTNEDAQLVATLLSIAKSTRAFLALLLAQIDLHPGQDQLLVRLTPGESVSVSMLADQLAVRPSTVSKMLDRLIEKNLVLRESNSRDARRTMVTLTSAGEAAKERVLALWMRLETELGNAMEERERSALLSSLQQVDQLLSVRLRRLR
ncbi:transcriptional regulator [Aureimonas ureilytica]|uniref:Transcriptional regulator n=2 Tax=Aureimonas ureilytica TaxID=401562 RepID=A0A175R8M8_9HYPH|nr:MULTISPECIES: MarR family winged helix-turn-helix transcriptional regulator [unclassified Aureimonas]KTQ95380.1 transcriptional regulator [Aureimonas ureilytica]KTR03216.1 transcriptional regulator [Aureimonas ureilytica]